MDATAKVACRIGNDAVPSSAVVSAGSTNTNPSSNVVMKPDIASMTSSLSSSSSAVNTTSNASSLLRNPPVAMDEKTESEDMTTNVLQMADESLILETSASPSTSNDTGGGTSAIINNDNNDNKGDPSVPSSSAATSSSNAAANISSSSVTGNTTKPPRFKGPMRKQHQSPRHPRMRHHSAAAAAAIAGLTGPSSVSPVHHLRRPPRTGGSGISSELSPMFSNHSNHHSGIRGSGVPKRRQKSAHLTMTHHHSGGASLPTSSATAPLPGSASFSRDHHHNHGAHVPHHHHHHSRSRGSRTPPPKRPKSAIVAAEVGERSSSNLHHYAGNHDNNGHNNNPALIAADALYSSRSAQTQSETAVVHPASLIHSPSSSTVMAGTVRTGTAVVGFPATTAASSTTAAADSVINNTTSVRRLNGGSTSSSMKTAPAPATMAVPMAGAVRATHPPQTPHHSHAHSHHHHSQSTAPVVVSHPVHPAHPSQHPSQGPPTAMVNEQHSADTGGSLSMAGREVSTARIYAVNFANIYYCKLIDEPSQLERIYAKHACINRVQPREYIQHSSSEVFCGIHERLPLKKICSNVSPPSNPSPSSSTTVTTTNTPSATTATATATAPTSTAPAPSSVSTSAAARGSQTIGGTEDHGEHAGGSGSLAGLARAAGAAAKKRRSPVIAVNIEYLDYQYTGQRSILVSVHGTMTMQPSGQNRPFQQVFVITHSAGCHWELVNDILRFTDDLRNPTTVASETPTTNTTIRNADTNVGGLVVVSEPPPSSSASTRSKISRDALRTPQYSHQHHPHHHSHPTHSHHQRAVSAAVQHPSAGVVSPSPHHHHHPLIHAAGGERSTRAHHTSAHGHNSAAVSAAPAGVTAAVAAGVPSPIAEQHHPRRPHHHNGGHHPSHHHHSHGAHSSGHSSHHHSHHHHHSSHNSGHHGATHHHSAVAHGSAHHHHLSHHPHSHPLRSVPLVSGVGGSDTISNLNGSANTNCTSHPPSKQPSAMPSEFHTNSSSNQFVNHSYSHPHHHTHHSTAVDAHGHHHHRSTTRMRANLGQTSGSVVGNGATDGSHVTAKAATSHHRAHPPGPSMMDRSRRSMTHVIGSDGSRSSRGGVGAGAGSITGIAHSQGSLTTSAASAVAHGTHGSHTSGDIHGNPPTKSGITGDKKSTSLGSVSVSGRRSIGSSRDHRNAMMNGGSSHSLGSTMDMMHRSGMNSRDRSGAAATAGGGRLSAAVRSGAVGLLSGHSPRNPPSTYSSHNNIIENACFMNNLPPDMTDSDLSNLLMRELHRRFGSGSDRSSSGTSSSGAIGEPGGSSSSSSSTSVSQNGGSSSSSSLSSSSSSGVSSVNGNNNNNLSQSDSNGSEFVLNRVDLIRHKQIAFIYFGNARSFHAAMKLQTVSCPKSGRVLKIAKKKAMPRRGSGPPYQQHPGCSHRGSHPSSMVSDRVNIKNGPMNNNNNNNIKNPGVSTMDLTGSSMDPSISRIGKAMILANATDVNGATSAGSVVSSAAMGIHGSEDSTSRMSGHPTSVAGGGGSSRKMRGSMINNGGSHGKVPVGGSSGSDQGPPPARRGRPSRRL